MAVSFFPVPLGKKGSMLPVLPILLVVFLMVKKGWCEHLCGYVPSGRHFLLSSKKQTDASSNFCESSFFGTIRTRVIDTDVSCRRKRGATTIAASLTPWLVLHRYCCLCLFHFIIVFGGSRSIASRQTREREGPLVERISRLGIIRRRGYLFMWVRI